MVDALGSRSDVILPDGPTVGLDPTLPVSERVLGFWFGPAPLPPDCTTRAKWWFAKNDGVDAAIITLFAKDYGDAAAGRLDDLLETPRGALALVLLLDQFPRNMFRGSEKSFASDAKARDVATEILKRGHDQALSPTERLFTILPYMHSEDLVDQDRCVALAERLDLGDTLEYAHAHRDLIVEYGRFPHRNATLGRENTAAEETYLARPDAGF